jgi:RNA polymerase sigma-70 factor, ECF subfamily
MCVDVGVEALQSVWSCGKVASVRAYPQVDEGSTDADVARAVMGGAGERAEAALAGRFRRRLVLYGMRHLRDRSLAEDLAQDVLATTLARLRSGDVREPEHIGSFVLGMARRMLVDMERRGRRADALSLAAARERSEAVGPAEVLDTHRLAEALAALPERERAVVVLTFHEDRSAREIGDSLGLAPGHVRVLRHRAIARLGELMGVRELTGDTEAS